MKAMSRLPVCAMLSLVLLQPLAGFAMRCGDKLVYEGDSDYTVTQKCGEPKARQMIEQVIPLYNGAGYYIGSNTNIIEVWIYQKSSADFQYELIFDRGVVKEIKANRNP